MWSDDIDADKWKSAFSNTFNEQNHLNGISLYLHLPFCESLCTYCGCNKKITTNHAVEGEYIAAILREWHMYRRLMTQTPVIREIHLGGGTPTFFSAENLRRLITAIVQNSIVHPHHEFSIEGHPNNTTGEHLHVLAKLGFTRISYGVQDTNPDVQRLINRIQPLQNVIRATTLARQHGFRSVNFDLIYGLPSQTTHSIERTISEVIELKPDRLALYSYAHVPWTSKSQRLFNTDDLPQGEEKLQLYMTARSLLLNNGYRDIGMDHFSHESDDLFTAWKKGTLHRNFMGYTTVRSALLLGLGVSAISDTGGHFAQNEKTLHHYYAAIKGDRLAIKKGHALSAADIRMRKYILDISCKGQTLLDPMDTPLLSNKTFPRLQQLQQDHLIEWSGNTVCVTGKGHYFIRNVCSAFDQYLDNGDERQGTFSKAI
jgi:oxygen-independent coproporphyrinogen-3 oxidase